MAKKSTKSNNFDIKKLMDTSGSYKNLIYGVITVVILFVIIFLGVRTISQNQTGEVDEGAVTVDESEQQNEYTVAEGDTLWSISEDVYGTGFDWQVIADANDIASPDDVEEGQVLTIPKLTPAEGEEIASEEGAESEEAMEEETEEATPTSAPTATTAPTATPEAIGGQESGASKGADPSAAEYTVEKGDYLWEIAQEQYGDPYRWVDIARANDLDNPDVIHAGNVLAIPR